MRKNANDTRPYFGGGRVGAVADDLIFSSIQATTENGKNKMNEYSLVDAFPCSPECSPVKGVGEFQQYHPAATSEGGFPSSRSNVRGDSHDVIPYEKDEVDRGLYDEGQEASDGRKPLNGLDNKYAATPSPRPIKSIAHPGMILETPPLLSTVKEDKSSDEEYKNGCGEWVGIGFGESLALSVCSESPETINPPNQNSNSTIHDKHIPRSIDFKRFDNSDKLPKLEEDKISTDRRASNVLGMKAQQSVAKVLHNVDELSVDLSLLGDLESVTSAMTKEDCVDLAKRLEKMEMQLLSLAGQTSKADAMRALAKSVHAQSKRANALQKKVKKQEKKISTLNDMCERLMESKRQSKIIQSTMQKEINDLKEMNSCLSLAFHESTAENDELTSKLRKAQGENVEKSKLLLQSYSETTSASNEIKSKYNELSKESQRRAEEDKTIIQKLEADMKAMVKAHARKERRSERKVQILVEIKSALEQQIHLLEEGEGGSDDEYDLD